MGKAYPAVPPASEAAVGRLEIGKNGGAAALRRAAGLSTFVLIVADYMSECPIVLGVKSRFDRSIATL